MNPSGGSGTSRENLEPFEVEIRWSGPLPESARRVGRAVSRLEGLPSLPEVLIELLEIMSDEAASTDRVVSRIELDPPLCSKILRLVNSAFYGFPRRIASLQRAVVMLGFHTIRHVALGATVMDLFDARASEELDPHALWKHSVYCGTCSTLLGAFLEVGERDSLFSAGLMHDIGKLALREVAPDEFRGAIELARKERIPLHVAEGRTIGIDHARVAGILARAWDFPPGLRQLLASHHDRPSTCRLPPEYEMACHVLYASNLLAHKLLDSPEAVATREEDWRDLSNLLSFWRLSPTELTQMESEVKKRADAALLALGVPGL